MSILLFIAIIVVLVLAHEFGHFLVAKICKMRVDEFGIFFPPKLFGKKFGETEYTINAVPLGGFVRIYGESPDEVEERDRARSFGARPRILQALVIVAGVAFNFLFAWALLSFGYMQGVPMSGDLPAGATVHSSALTITQVVPKSPAEKAGLLPGDVITGAVAGKDTLTDITSDGVSAFILAHDKGAVTISYRRGDSPTQDVSVTPESGVPGIDHPAVGIAMDKVSVVSLPFVASIREGWNRTVDFTYLIIGFFQSLFTGHANLAEVAGPVGIVSIVGQASALGFMHVLILTAFISVNLAVVNLIPIPALDGGRLLFILIEAIKRSPINPRVAYIANATGFVLLILLMIVITYHDILRILGG